ncbi:hypothetical protein [Ferrovibrio sp.]|uniref:hypothetical protein n=1 Tax=Ferrovibrio sp. TaxID=1917215 RepID=UPI0035B0E3F7
MSNTQDLIGKLLPEGTPRDAIHIAVAPVVAAYGELQPGQRVTLSLWREEGPVAYASEDQVDGIVDPFLTAPVKEGERFFLFLFPNTITALRHEWSHPAFPAQQPMGADRVASEAWLRNYAERYCANYEEMVSGAVSRRGYCFGDDDGPPQYRNAAAEFWHHIEVVTGKKFDKDHRENTPFRCAC